jgi:hypothetical protein
MHHTTSGAWICNYYVILLVREREGQRGMHFSIKLIELYQPILLQPKTSSIFSLCSESLPGGTMWYQNCGVGRTTKLLALGAIRRSVVIE